MKKILITLFILFFSISSFAEDELDYITDSSKESIILLNDNLRRTTRRIRELEGGIPLTSGVTGILPIANGGTGQDTAQEAIDALLPSQTSNSGKYLTTNGTTASWGTVTIPHNTDYSFSAYNSANQNSLTTDTDLSFDTEEFDTGSNFSTSTYKFTAPVDGKYLFTLSSLYTVSGNPGAGGSTVKFILQKNASTVVAYMGGEHFPQNSPGQSSVSGSVILSLSATDTVRATLLFTQSATETVSITHGSGKTIFTGCYLP